ncbi:MAG: hypothetical protein ACK5SI_05210 [Planctomycetia bacterium]|jgi:hypothetical protein
MAATRAATDGRVYEIADLFPPQGRHAWIGRAAPFSAVPLDFAGCTNARLPGDLHGTFDSVWHVETPLSDHGGGRFELVIDEMIRLLGSHGRIVVRFRETAELSVVSLKHVVGRRLDTVAGVGRQWSIDGEQFVELSIERQRLEDQRDRRWTFAVVTQGRKPDMVVRFLQSIRCQDPSHEHEILVWGPINDAYAPFGVRVEDRRYRDDVAEISRKKNDIAAAASHANLLIAHDRYTLDPGFLAGFETFGYDFDLVAVAQWYDDGHPFPAYCALPGHALVGSATVIDCATANSLWPLQFVGGGLIVAKTRALRQIRFNDLLFWCEAEDVELGRAFRDRGLPPRMNPWSSATTYGVDRGWFSRHFTREDQFVETPGRAEAATQRRLLTTLGKIRREVARVVRQLGGGPG